MTAWQPEPRSVYRDVEAAVREYAKAETGSFDVWGPRWELADKVNGKDRHGRLSENYCAQVARALRTCTEEGWLVREGTGRDARYMTLAVKKLQDEAAAELSRQTRAELDRWDEARAALVRLGYAPRDGGRSISLSLEEWERVVSVMAALDGPETVKAADGETTLSRFRVAGVVYAPDRLQAQHRVDAAGIYLDKAVVTEAGQ